MWFLWFLLSASFFFFRLSEILQLASCLSHPLPSPPAIPREDLENRRDWREKKREEDSSWTLSISASVLKTEDPQQPTPTDSRPPLPSTSVVPPSSLASQVQTSKREGLAIHHHSHHQERTKSETEEAPSGHGNLSHSHSHTDHHSSRSSSSIGVKTSAEQSGEDRRRAGGGVREEDGEIRLPLSSTDKKSTAVILSTPGGERTRDLEEGRGLEQKTKHKNPIPMATPLHHGDHSRPMTNDHRSDGDPCRDIRLKVKRRLKKENLHWLIDLPALQQKEELQILWNQLYFKYYRSDSRFLILSFFLSFLSLSFFSAVVFFMVW